MRNILNPPPPAPPDPDAPPQTATVADDPVVERLLAPRLALTVATVVFVVTAALVVAPYFLKPTFNEVYDHFRAVDRVGLPFILYNIPQVVDAYLPRRVVEDLADIPNIVGLKDSSGNLTYTMELLQGYDSEAGRLIDLLAPDVAVSTPDATATGALAGSLTVNVEPWPYSLSRWISPPCNRATSRARARPSPVPFSWPDAGSRRLAPTAKNAKAGQEDKDPYGGFIFRMYRKLLLSAIRYRSPGLQGVNWPAPPVDCAGVGRTITG